MNIKKISIIIILMVILINTIFSIKSYAFSQIISDGDGFLDASNGEQNPINTGELGKTNTSIYNILLGIGIVVAVVVGAVLGIQFIFQSAEGKAKISEALIPYIVGCFIVFGAFGIWKIAINAGQSITQQTNGGKKTEPISVIVTCPNCGNKYTLTPAQLQKYNNGSSFSLSCGHQYKKGDGLEQTDV